MKAIIVVLAFAALAYAHGQDDKVEPQVCTPGSTKQIECNHCFCILDGSGWGCTQKGCHTEILPIAYVERSPSEPEAK